MDVQKKYFTKISEKNQYYEKETGIEVIITKRKSLRYLIMNQKLRKRFVYQNIGFVRTYKRLSAETETIAK